MADTTLAEPSSSRVIEQPLKRKLHIMDLPSESLAGIFKHASSADLVALSLVSKRFRELAAGQLYRNFHIVFPDEDDPSYDSPIDGLAGGLDTFVASDFNYAQFLRKIALDTLSGGLKGERSYRHYVLSVSCGKFMNTLLLLTLRKARSLETFKWNIRVELSRPVFKALHNISALQHLHLRMQAGPSIYEEPPALGSNDAYHESIPILPPPSTFPSIAFNIFKPPPKPKSKSRKPVAPGATPPTISGFKDLKSLSILDLDTLDYIDEIRTCLQNCSHTLNTFNLSFSESLARQARKSAQELETEDSDVEIDDFGNAIDPPHPQAPEDDTSGPARAFRAEKMRRDQEAVLGRIFGVELVASQSQEADDTSNENSEQADDDPARAFVQSLRSMANRLMSAAGGPGVRTSQQRESLDIIEKAARLYVDSVSKTQDKRREEQEGESARTAEAGSSQTAPAAENASAEETSASVFDNGESSQAAAQREDVTPDDIDIELPDQADVETITAGASAEESTAPRLDFDAALEELQTLLNDLTDGNKQMQSLQAGVSVADLEMYHSVSTAMIGELNDLLKANKISECSPEYEDFKLRLSDLKQKITSSLNQHRSLGENVAIEGEPSATNMNQYVRETRGLALETLGIHLIPIKASVLSKAIDFTVLKRISLLNVGVQASFWTHLSKENKTSPLPLQMIHTDNVSLPFLNLVSELDLVTELFLLERSPKTNVETLAPKTNVGLMEIRRMALKKHMPTMRRLMIKNEDDYAWDMDKKTLVLICKKGAMLEELALIIGVRPSHVLLQHITRMTNLRAFHILTFRTDDTCMWVMRELRRFIVDNVSHNPKMKLEYLALDGNLERLVRPPKRIASKITSKGKSKDGSQVDYIAYKQSNGSDSEAEPSGSQSSAPSFVIPAELNPLGEPAEETDTEDEAPSGLKLESLEGLRFYDVHNVRIFKKEVMAGRL